MNTLAQVIDHVGWLLKYKNELGISHRIVECITPQDMFEVATELNIGELCLKSNVGVSFLVFFDGEYIVDGHIWILKPKPSIVLSMRHSYVLIHLVNAHRRHLVDYANRYRLSEHNIGSVYRHSRLIDEIVDNMGLAIVEWAVQSEQVNIDVSQQDIDEPKGERVVSIGRHQTYHDQINFTSPFLYHQHRHNDEQTYAWGCYVKTQNSVTYSLSMFC